MDDQGIIERQQVSKEIRPIEQLTPRQSAYLKKLWRIYKAKAIERRYIRAMTITGGITLVFFAISIFAMNQEWTPSAAWLLGFGSGLFEILFVVTMAQKRLWPGMACIIDWKRLEEIVTNPIEN